MALPLGEAGPSLRAPSDGGELTVETIRALIKQSLPNSLSNIVTTPLAAGRSFNNKIYFIHTEDAQGTQRSYVLKVNGKGFGPAKIENEVSCLLLLQRFCSDLPVPRVLTWSRDGINVTRYDEHEGLITSTAGGMFDQHVPGWIIMTICPGSPLEPAELSPEARSSLSLQLAGVLSSWRRHIPKSSSCGNIHFAPSSTTSKRSMYNPAASFNLDLHVYGLIGSGDDFGPRMGSLLEYWQTELRWQVKQLSTKPIYGSNCEALSARLRDFMDWTMQDLPLFTQDNDANFTFTHTDFFPRNILVQGDPPQISGIVDFEFSGFFPPMEEFVQEWLPNDDDSDWPQDMYDMILTELERLGASSPRSLSSTEWKHIKNLNALRNYIAPWWLGDASPTDGEDTEVELLQARQEVETALDGLEMLINVPLERRHEAERGTQVQHGP